MRACICICSFNEYATIRAQTPNTLIAIVYEPMCVYVCESTIGIYVSEFVLHFHFRCSFILIALHWISIFSTSAVLLVYFSENINELAAIHWRSFSRQQYFDSNGLFISTVFSIPILLNCMLMIVSATETTGNYCVQLKFDRKVGMRVNGMRSWEYVHENGSNETQPKYA